MLNFERTAAIEAAGTAAAIAHRLGLIEVAANAKITIGTARYQSGDRAGLDELEEAVELCRARRLLALRRACQNLAFAAVEEGELARSQALLAEVSNHVQGGHNLATGYSTEAITAYFAGDFERLLAAADAIVATPTGSWDLQVRGLRACLRVLRGEPVPGPPHADDITDILTMARGSGFHRPRWGALATAALCRALQGRRKDAVELLAELAKARAAVPALVTGEWSAAASVAAALCGREAAVTVRTLIEPASYLTPWGRAALQVVTAAIADADSEHTRAAELYAEAAQIYARIPNTTEQHLAMALAAGALSRVEDGQPARALLAEVRAFAMRNHAPGLLNLTHPSTPGAAWSSDLAS
jgi:hypothetical protein